MFSDDIEHPRDGFSLVELSIVLVILGLLTGGILAGQSLIRAAELRSISTEAQRYVTAAYTFRDKYFQGPGDMNNATKFWGDDSANCADAAIPNGTPGTCNGDGNGQMSASAVLNTTSENFQFWKQLALAGLIEGSFSGITGTTSLYSAGTNAPAGRISSSGWGAVAYLDGSAAACPNCYGPGSMYGNSMLYGGLSGGGGSGPGTALLRPEEAWNIDTKLDDGQPAQGRVLARFWNSQCGVNNSGALTQMNLDASYRLTDSSAQCALYFTKLF